MQWDNSIVMWDEEIMTFWDEDLAVAVWDDTVIENDSRERQGKKDGRRKRNSPSPGRAGRESRGQVLHT